MNHPMQKGLKYVKASNNKHALVTPSLSSYLDHDGFNRPARSHTLKSIGFDNGHTMSRHFIAITGCDIPSVTSHLAAYLLLGSLGTQEDQLWPICLFSCQSGRIIPPRGTHSHPETRDPAMWTISLQRLSERKGEGGGGGKGRKVERDKGNLP